MTTLLPTPWFVRFKPLSAPRSRLFCFHHAGGSASAFRTWASLLPSEIELWAVQLPGREGRLNEKPFSRFDEIIPAAIEQLRPYLDLPFTFLGYSIGSLVAFELCRQLRREGNALPRRLLVAASRPPHMPYRFEPTHTRPDDQFVTIVRERYNAIPDAVLKDPELLKLLLPTLRADMGVVETYTYSEEPALAIPITAFAGSQDPEATLAEVETWKNHTSRRFDCHQMPGDHFFLNTARDRILRIVNTRLVADDMS